jgi:hypothetical protein
VSEKPQQYIYYPLSSVLLYNGVTLAHFSLASLGLWLGYREWWIGSALALLYLVFAFGQMYVLMPLKVCPNCPYYRLKDSRCISALNLLSRLIARKGKIENFSKRAEGPFCHNNLYMAALIAPIPLMLPGLVINFSLALLVILIVVVSLLLFRFLVLFSKVACVHCYARQKCPNAAMMGLND